MWEPTVTQSDAESEKSLKIIAITSCAGEFKNILQILSALPRNFPAAIVIIQQPCALVAEYAAKVLDSEIDLRVKQISNGERLSSGVVYFAVANQGFSITTNWTLCFVNTATVYSQTNLFLTSLALNCKADAIAVALTVNDDVLGLQAIKQYGGTTISQTEQTLPLLSKSQPLGETQVIDFLLPLEKIAPALMDLVMPQQFPKSLALEIVENQLEYEPTSYAVANESV
ncbi:MAG: chemotaxis protein CheB [Nostoc sp. C3-bin3]|nr:chemotaxis protein CheB [Nostoc sp. C3-bin3]